MCLYVKKNTRIKIVKRERTVYKVVAHPFINSQPQSPYQRQVFRIGDLLSIDGNLEILNSRISSKTVEKGFHTFRNMEDALHEIKSFNRYWRHIQEYEAMSIVECKIPVGAQIIKGDFESCESYVSSMIKYEKTIKFFDLRYLDDVE